MKFAVVVLTFFTVLFSAHGENSTNAFECFTPGLETSTALYSRDLRTFKLRQGNRVLSLELERQGVKLEPKRLVYGAEALKTFKAVKLELTFNETEDRAEATLTGGVNGVPVNWLCVRQLYGP